jgi:hypothetical protein
VSEVVERLDGEWDKTIEIFQAQVSLMDFRFMKRKSAEVEDFYNKLEEEKKEKDAERKKAGKNYNPTKQDELFDAVYKRAMKARNSSSFYTDVIAGQKEVDVFKKRSMILAKSALSSMGKYSNDWTGR